MVGQPDAVVRPEEEISFIRHGACIDREKECLTATSTDRESDLSRIGEVNVLSRLLQQPTLHDRIEEPLDRSMKKLCGRCETLEIEIDRDRVSLTRTNPFAVLTELEALLVVESDNLFKLISVNLLPVSIHRRDQILDRNPSLTVESDADLLRFMPEYETKKLAGANDCRAHVGRDKGCGKN